MAIDQAWWQRSAGWRSSRGSYAEANRLGNESLKLLEEQGDLARLTGTLRKLGMISSFEGDQPRARELLARSAGAGSCLNHLGSVAILRGDLRQARSLLYESLVASRDRDRRRLAFTLSAVADLVALEGEPDRAIRLNAAGLHAPPTGPVWTQREREVAGLIARGLTNRQIAEALIVSEGTAANYVQRVMNRLEVHNRAQVAAWAVERRLHQEASAPDPAL